MRIHAGGGDLLLERDFAAGLRRIQPLPSQLTKISTPITFMGSLRMRLLRLSGLLSWSLQRTNFSMRAGQENEGTADFARSRSRCTTSLFH